MRVYGYTIGYLYELVALDNVSVPITPLLGLPRLEQGRSDGVP